jgi:hypothetical protein
MKCESVQKEILNDDRMSSGAEHHLESCQSCRELRAVADSLVTVGKQISEVDLSPQAIEETRRRADQIISIRRVAAPRRRRLASHWRPLAAAAALLMVITIATRISRLTQEDPHPRDPRIERLAAVELDDHIDRLFANLELRLEELHRRPESGPTPDSFNTRASQLKDKIASHTSDIETELQGPAIAVAAN